MDPHRRQVRHLGAHPRTDRIGQGSRRADDSRAEPPRHQKFQAVNCAALPDTLFESEIFGYEKGAFTGAHDRKPGRLELANNGTLFLDEIGDLSIVAQAKLLRVLEERRFERLGGNKSIEVDFRLISATNRPLDQFVRDGGSARTSTTASTRSRSGCRRCASAPVDIPCSPSASSRALLRRQRPAARREDVREGGARPADAVSLAGQHPRARRAPVSRAALSSPGRVIALGDIEFLHASETPVEAARERLPSLAEAERAHIVRVLESVQLEQEAGGPRARDQPRHALSEDRRIRPRGEAAASRNRHTSAKE